MKGKLLFNLSALAMLIQPTATLAEHHEGKTKLKGHFRWRTESANNAGYAGPKYNVHLLRARLGMDIKASSKVDLYLEAHGAKNIGGQNGLGQETSSTAVDDLVGLHQAYANTRFMDNLHVKLGRQILSYGDQMVISPLEWNNTGRVFDAAKVTYKFWKGKVDAFYSVLASNATTTRKDEDELSGLYSNFNFGDWAKDFDLYVLYRTQRTATGGPTLTMLGHRIKSKIGKVDYRFEASVQKENTTTAPAKKGGQYNLEVGYTFDWQNLRLGAQYFVAGKNYVQLYPLGHAYLGYADIFGRRNIKGLVFHTKANISDTWMAKLDYHMFSKHDKDASAYKVNGTTAYTGSSTSDKLGSEIDLIIKNQFQENASITFGVSRFMAGDFMKSVSSQKEKNFNLGYLTYMVKF